jgi:hypothetical protein
MLKKIFGRASCFVVDKLYDTMKKNKYLIIGLISLILSGAIIYSAPINILLFPTQEMELRGELEYGALTKEFLIMQEITTTKEYLSAVEIAMVSSGMTYLNDNTLVILDANYKPLYVHLFTNENMNRIKYQSFKFSEKIRVGKGKQIIICLSTFTGDKDSNLAIPRTPTGRLGKLSVKPVANGDVIGTLKGSGQVFLLEGSLYMRTYESNYGSVNWFKIFLFAIASLLSLLVVFAEKIQAFVAGEHGHNTDDRHPSKFNIFLAENPKKSITFVGFIAAIASCYPVVFFGMSFISPVQKTLYSYPPYLPGYPFDAIIENFRGSDVGATMWSIMPNTVVQYNALMQYFEFPFWSRYVAGGVPLFAQGYSGIGDILHWIPLFLGGSAIGWDIKFVLSKAIFSVGMGLLVFRLTRHFLASSLIAISSCFLGFFAYRFNHPAFFVLTYAPWIVLQWDRLGELLALQHPRIRSCIIQGLLLAAVTWLQLNAGVPKEGVITACFMHALGMLFFVDNIRHHRGWIQSILITTGFCCAVIMIASPYWMLFLDALSKSFTSYDIPTVYTFPLWRIVGFFDNFFFQQIDGTLGAPSTNIFVLLCLASAIVSLRWYKSFKLFGTMLLFFLALSVAYGLIPNFILISIPFINKIQHVYNAFSVPMMILALIFAGCGIHQYLELSVKHKKEVIAWFLSVFIGFVVVYLLAIILSQHPAAYSGKAVWLILPFIAVVFTMGWTLYRQAESGVWSKRILIILACCFLLLHARHGMHLMTGIRGIDHFVLNPEERANFSNKSAAMEFVKNRIKEQKVPVRVIGEDNVLFPGYNSMLGFEGLVAVEALRNKHFDELLAIVDYPVTEWGWLHLIKSEQVPSRAAALDLLGVRCIVAKPGTQVPNGVKLIHSSDLDVWERETVWPRAFFVNQVFEMHKPSDILAALAKVPHVPFAAVESQFIPKWMPKNNDDASQVVLARQYLLTNNTTRFSVDATGPGIIVLGETYYPEDFVARLNGKRADYIRVNQAFKGILVQEAGRYDVSYTYRPARLTQSIILSICGMFLLLIVSVILPGLDYLKSRRKL